MIDHAYRALFDNDKLSTRREADGIAHRYNGLKVAKIALFRRQTVHEGEKLFFAAGLFDKITELIVSTRIDGPVLGHRQRTHGPSVRHFNGIPRSPVVGQGDTEAPKIH